MENNTSAPVCQHSYDGEISQKVGRTVALFFIMSLALVGNILAIVVFKRKPATRTKTNCFIVNMAASDLLFSFFTLPLRMVHIWLGGSRFLVGGAVGEFFCKFVLFVTDISTAVSVQSLVLIAVERFTAVVYPLKAKKFTSRLQTILVIVTWTVAAALHSPYFYFLRVKTRCNNLYCIEDWAPLPNKTHKIYFTTLCIVILYILLLAIAILYKSFSLNLRRTKVPGGHDLESKPVIRRRERNWRITKMSICIVIAFALCSLPFATCVMIHFFSPLMPTFSFCTAALNLVWANSAINPWILFYFCGNFRRGLRDMFGCCPCCCSRRSNPVVGRNIELQEMHRQKYSGKLKRGTCNCEK